MNSVSRIPSLFILSVITLLSIARTYAEIEAAAEEVFSAYAEALGGEKAYAAIDTALMSMTMEMPAIGMSMVRKVSFKQPNRVFVDIDIPGLGKMKQGFDGEKGWSIDPVQGSRELKGAELEKLLSETDFKEGLNLSEEYSSAKVTGKDSEGLIVVECVTEEGSHAETLYFEEDTGLLRKMETVEDMGDQGEVPVSSQVVDYETIGDLLLPVRIDAQMMGMSMIMKITSFEPNVPVDETLFDRPE